MKSGSFFLICILLIAGTGAVWDSLAVKKVREGVRQFLAGEYGAAGESFAAADAAQPDDDRIAFDRACTLSAQGDTDEAKQLFQLAALARDVRLAADAHYNMGNLEATAAKEYLGDDPVNVEPDRRSEAVSGLMTAVGHYRDSLRVDPTHAEARHNLELIRLFIKYIQAEWERLDREKAREELSLLEFLAMIETRQQELLTVTGQLGREPESPEQRQALRDSADAQRLLQEEIEPLREKINAEIQGASGGQQGTDPEQTQRVLGLLHQLTDTAGEMMLKAADQLQTTDTREAAEAQRETLDQLHQIYMVLAPFDRILQRAIPVQEQRITASQETMDLQTASDDVGTDANDGNLESGSEQAWRQSRISDWSRLLALKAESELPEVTAQLETAAEQSSQDPQDAANGAAPSDPTPDSDPTAPLQALRESMQKAVELAPQVEQSSLSAENHLELGDTAQAVPDQQEALRLLKEIAEPLQKQQDQKQQDQDQQQGQNDEQQEQNSGNNSQDRQPKPQEPKPESSADQRQRQQESAQQRAEAVLRRARERERAHREMEKEIRRILGGVIPVERDW